MEGKTLSTALVATLDRLICAATCYHPSRKLYFIVSFCDPKHVHAATTLVRSSNLVSSLTHSTISSQLEPGY